MSSLTDLYNILACPKCKTALTLSADDQGCVCESCRVVYPIIDSVPHLVMEEASALQEAGAEITDKGFSASQGEQAIFQVVEGKQKGEQIVVDKGTCRAVGRSVDDIEKTKVFSFDSAMTLDEASKKLVMQYLSHQFQKKSDSSSLSGGSSSGERLGGFVRGPDIQVRDISISRLHAMIFYDESGAIGILDLVSKNGTYVNGAEVESKLLKSGDLVALGSTKLRLQ